MGREANLRFVNSKEVSQIKLQARRCCRVGCPDRYAETERFQLLLLLYPFNKEVIESVQVMLSVQVCPHCQPNCRVSEIVSGTNLTAWRAAFREASGNQGHVLDPERAKIAWKSLGRYVKNDSDISTGHGERVN